MRRCRLLPTLPVVVAMLAAGCGGSGQSPGVARITAVRTTPQSAAVAFSACMRSHGVPSFPDPPSPGARSHKPTLQQLGVSASALNAAANACDHLIPAGSGGPPQQTAQEQRTQVADGLSFARCMRDHGVTRFPDPSAQGELSVEMVQAQGIDVHSPAVLQAVQACLPASHGALTPAKVREALNHAGG